MRNLEQEPATNESAPLLVLKLQAQLNQKKPNWVQIKQTGEAISSVEPTNGWGPYGQAQYYINCPKPDPTKALALLDKARAAKVVPPGTGSAYWMLWLKRKWWLFLLLLGGAGAGAKAAIDKRRKAQLAGLEAAGAGDPTTTDGGTETVAPSDESGATVTSAVAGPEEELPVIAGAPTVSDGESSGGEETAGAG